MGQSNTTVKVICRAVRLRRCTKCHSVLKANANTYFIDTSRIVVFGGSAGGVISLLNALEYDNSTNDFPYSSKTKWLHCYRRPLINDDPISTVGYNSYDADDSPVLMFHAKEYDSGW
jgi:dipeptidyl aminopeptidase/acylaminoacyl peptidase